MWDRPRGTYEDDLPTSDGGVERRDLAWLLAVVIRQAKKQHDADGPHHYSYGDSNASQDRSIGLPSEGGDTLRIQPCKMVSPKP